MQRVRMMICVLGLLSLMLGCPAGSNFVREERGSHSGVRNDNNLLTLVNMGEGRVARESNTPAEQAYGALLENLNKLKASLNYQPEEFNRSQFDNIFQVWVDSQGVKKEREYEEKVYSSLNRDVEALSNLKIVVDNLASAGTHVVDWTIAMKLLDNLKSSAEYISEVINDKGSILSRDNLLALRASNNVVDMQDFKYILDLMLSIRNNLIERVKIMLRGAAGLATMKVLARANIRALILHLDKIIEEDGFLYKSIFSTCKPILGLRGLRDLMRIRVNKLGH
ncbi:hypothetical protein [Borrelia turicatae]|uniref:Lipoprotein n=1 Tax=Borrelia turicatae (strain 91E135) TaxID=314724 RepID=T1ECJ1_BORT9|nr:hypothetical protein [Borrelia turicatae]ADN26451.1 hypothetical protein BTA024 [Borrelia turicatae 91E135]UPA13954.1 hypothetical protein bt91E135_001116 [Borrelia turicatae 91E135]